MEHRDIQRAQEAGLAIAKGELAKELKKQEQDLDALRRRVRISSKALDDAKIELALREGWLAGLKEAIRRIDVAPGGQDADA